MPITLRLGIPGISYSDLFDPDRLRELHHIFDAELAATNPELFAAWRSYRNNPTEPKTPVEISALLVGVAGCISRFLARLFQVETDAEALATATSDQNPVFRFKIDFVRRRVLPALKKISVPQDASSRAALEQRVAGLRGAGADIELATALAAAEKLICCGAPVVKERVAGEAVTPAGSPVTEPWIVPANPLSAAAVSVTACAVPPAVRLTLVGLEESEKSGAGAAATVMVMGTV